MTCNAERAVNTNRRQLVRTDRNFMSSEQQIRGRESLSHGRNVLAA